LRLYQQTPLFKRAGIDKPTNSSESLIAKAAESAGAMSTSSTSFDISANARFHSSAKGPEAGFLGKVPTLFCGCYG
jgi:hypothetical protein